MKKLLALLAAAIAVSAAAAEYRLAEEGRSDYLIVLPERPTATERTAAAELQAYLEKISGVKLPVADRPAAGKKALYVGWSDGAKQLLGDGVRPEGMKPDQVLLRSFASGDIVLTGHSVRGPLYAVYTLLEEVLGVRFFTHDAEMVPRRRRLVLPELNIDYAPPIAVRQNSNPEFTNQPRFAARRRINGEGVTPEFGGSASRGVVANRSHTMAWLVPTESFFKDHPTWYAKDAVFPGSKPEYYSFHEGRRRPGHDGQLCLTNAEMREVLIGQAKALLRRLAPNNHTIMITQNDNTAYCRCPACSAKAKQLGGQTDLLLWFLNGVIRELDREFPGIKVETFAYQYTITPPETVKPDPNLRIRLCLIEADSGKPLTAAANAFFRDCIAGWGKVTENLCIWNYVTNFTNYGLIHPNFTSFGPDLALFAANGVTDVFCQDSNLAGRAGYFPELRGYLLSHLLWNPAADAARLTDEFLDGYYGAAAPAVKAYLAHFQAIADRTAAVIDCYMMDTAVWLSWSELAAGRPLIEAALKAAAGDPAVLPRVRRLAAMQDWTTLWRREVGWLRPLAPVAEEISPAWVEALRARNLPMMAEIPKTTNYKNMYLRIGRSIEVVQRQLAAQLTPPSIDRSRIVVPEEVYDLAGGVRIDDAFAPGKRAVRLPMRHHHWPLKVWLPAWADAGRWEVSAELRLPAAVDKGRGVAAIAGIYVYGTNFAEKTVVPIAAAQLSNRSCRVIRLGVVDFKRDCQLYFEGAANDSVPELLVGRIFLRRVR